MQLQQFRKRTLYETTIFVSVLVAMSVIIYLLDMVNDDYIKSNTDAKTQVETIQRDFTALQQKYNFIVKNTDLYKEVEKKQQEGALLIGRQVMFEKFNQFRSQFDLSNLRLSVSPVQEIKNESLKRQYSTVSYSEINVELDVLYDENIYQLLSAMEHELSGICVISRLSMSIPKPLDETVLKVISEKGTYPLVKTVIKFNWYSINPVETADANKK